MKTKTRRIWAGCLVGAVALVGAGCRSDDAKDAAVTTTSAKAASGPSLAIMSPASGEAIKGNVVSVLVKLSGIDLVKADGDTSGRTGHLHAFIDREPVAKGAVIPKEAGIVHSADNPIVLSGLAVGEHTVHVVLGDGSHNRIGSSVDTVKVTVMGPTVDATAPATVAAGSPVRIDFKSSGVGIVKADGDASGATGHYHVFVDRPLPKIGEVIPKPDDGSIIHTAESFVEIPGLAAGEHVFFVVIGDGLHTPRNPLVADKVVVTIA